MTPVIVIGGPTASGKSGVAAALAERFSGTVINADSMQIYRGLPLLTAQPEPEQKSPHRLYGTQEPENLCSAARWRDMALAEIEKARAENRLPIVVGGTGFYIKTLLVGISPIPDVPHEARDAAAALQKKLGNPAFHAELAKRDPVMGEKLHPFNTQRLVRAWEVLETTGKSLAEWQAAPRVGPPAHLKFLTLTLLPARDRLYPACDKRFTMMIEQGALEEVKAFRAKHAGENGLSKALGYPELCDYLDGNISLEQAVIRAQKSTRHYAKRQVTWFRHQIKSDLVLPDPDPPFAWIEQNIRTQ